MKSPITNRINTTFIPVSDLRRSVRWYSELIGLPYDLEDVNPPVYNMPMSHSTGVVLDAGTEDVTPSPHPLFNFHADDIAAAYRFVQKLGYEISKEMVHFPDIAFFHIKDPDGNVIMIGDG